MNNTRKPDAFEPSDSRSGLAGDDTPFFNVKLKLKQKAERQKSQGNDCYMESTISRDKKGLSPNRQDMNESKEIINDCKENDQEELRRILKLKKTRTAPCAMIKGQSNKAILMGMRMHNSNRSHTNEENTVSDNRITTSSNMSSTNEESTVSEDNSQGGNNTPNTSDIP